MKNDKLDKFLEILSKDKSPTYEKIYYRPTKAKCVFGFIFSLLLSPH